MTTVKKTHNDFKRDIDEKLTEVDALIEKTQNKLTEIDAIRTSLVDGTDTPPTPPLATTLSNLRNVNTFFQSNKIDEINNFHNSLILGDDNTGVKSIKQEVLDTKKSIEASDTKSKATLTETETLLKGTQDQSEDITNGNEEERRPSLDTIKNNIVEINNFYGKSTISNIETFHDELFGAIPREEETDGEEKEPSLKEEIVIARNKANAIINKLEIKHKELLEFHKDIFGATEIIEEEDGTNTKEYTPGLSDKIKRIEAKLDDLLPQVGAATLYDAYEQTAKQHKIDASEAQTSFENVIKVIFAITTFIILLKLFKGQEIETMSMILTISPITGPLLWLAFIFRKNAFMHNRMYTEYIHKKNMSQTFTSLSEKLNEFENTKTQELLLEKVVETNAHNPSEALDKTKHCETPIEEVIDQIKDLGKVVDHLKPWSNKVSDVKSG